MPISDQEIINIGGSGGSSGITEIVAGNGIAVDSSILDKPVVSTLPLSIAGRRINASETLLPTSENIIISEITTSPVTLTLPLSSDYPVGTTWFSTRFINASDQVVTIETIDGSEFYQGRGNKINMVPGVAGTADITISAFNFAAFPPFPARNGWAIQGGIPVSMYALYSGTVDMSTFEGSGAPIEYDSDTETDNEEIIELENSNKERAILKKGGRTRVNVDLEINATGFSPAWNITIRGRVFRNGAYVNIGLISEAGTGNFGGEDAWVSKEYYFDAQPGDKLEQLLFSSGVNGELKSSTMRVYTNQ